MNTVCKSCGGGGVCKGGGSGWIMCKGWVVGVDIVCKGWGGGGGDSV